MSRLQEAYLTTIAPALRERFTIDNPMRVPKLEKIVISMGVGKAHLRALQAAPPRCHCQPHMRKVCGL